jgi:hypothetical protein
MASSGNFATLNSLIKSSTNTFSNGNCRITSSSGGWGAPLTLAANTGKFYVEINFVASDTNGGRIAVLPTNSAKYNDGDSSAAGSGDYAIEWKYDGDSNFITNNGSTTQSSVGSWAQGDVAAVAFDLDASPKTVQFYKNNSTIGSAENINTSATGPFTVMIYAHNAGTWHINAGQDSSFGGNETAGGNADGNGFGDFYYSPPTDFLALSSANLPISADIDPAQTDDDYPQKQFNAVAYDSTGDGQSITGVGFQPDLVWIKCRSDDQGNGLFDSSRGTSKVLESNSTNAENTSSGLTSFDSDGYTMGTYYNQSSRQYVSWCWRANGGTTASNSSGSITSTVQANTKSGFSIITYTGTGSAGATIGHGLSAKPAFIIVKNRTDTDSWAIYHESIGADFYTAFSGAIFSNNATFWNDTEPTTSVITLGTNNRVNGSSDNLVCYAWAQIEGYSKFGEFEGNGNADGPFIYTGFRPRMLFIKRNANSHAWKIFDTARNTNNLTDNSLSWDNTDAESSSNGIDILSNGFKLRNSNSSFNNSGSQFVFGAWGDVPFKYNNTF